MGSLTTSLIDDLKNELVVDVDEEVADLAVHVVIDDMMSCGR
jgi:hypothetical protein